MSAPFAPLSWLREALELSRHIARVDPSAHSVAEVMLCFPGPRIVLSHRLAHWLYSKRQYVLSRGLSELSKVVNAAEIHPGATLGRRVFIDHGVGVIIGETAVVEDDVMIMPGVLLAARVFKRGKRHPTVARGAFLGARAVILGDIRVGRGARVGAGAVVLHDVPDGARCTGVPAVSRVPPPPPRDPPTSPA